MLISQSGSSGGFALFFIPPPLDIRPPAPLRALSRRCAGGEYNLHKPASRTTALQVASFAEENNKNTAAYYRKKPHHPRRRFVFFANNFRSALFTCTKRRACVFRSTTQSRPRLGLVVRCGDVALSQKNMPFGAFLHHVQPKYQNNAIFLFISEKFSAMLEQAELRGIPMGPRGPPNAKERPKSTQKSLF